MEIKYQVFQIFYLELNKYDKSLPVGVVDRRSETQLQVGDFLLNLTIGG